MLLDSAEGLVYNPEENILYVFSSGGNVFCYSFVASSWTFLSGFFGVLGLHSIEVEGPKGKQFSCKIQDWLVRPDLTGGC